jgi:cold shock CspA family protein
MKNTNLTQTNAAIKLLDDYRTVFSVHDKNHIRGYLSASLTMLHSQNKQKIETIVEDLIDEQANEHSDELSFFKGCIKDIRIKNGKLSFGFITGDDNKEYFFHRGEVNPHEVLDNKGDYRGARVGFSPSHGVKGPTAKNVHLI